jgi:phenylpyruvate tautomerase PptA (4-oxalocrotonate tautomerase family)
MPTYTVTNSNFNLKPRQKKEIAKGITEIHNVVTGANKYFAQVIFSKTKDNDHFMGGKKVTDPQIFLHGQIRTGRSSNIKKKLAKIDS